MTAYNQERTFSHAIKSEHKYIHHRWQTVRMIEFRYTNGDTELFTRVNGGLAWPTIEAPAYFCVFAQQQKENQYGKKPLVQFYELEDSEGNINNFLKQVCAIAEHYKVYATFGNSENAAFLEKARSCKLFMPQKLTGVMDFNYGLEIIKAWFKAGALIIMDKSILKAQLSSLRETELSEAPDRYNAINGLRYVVTGFDDWMDDRPVCDGPHGKLDVESMVE
jgi:hypothetical protein